MTQRSCGVLLPLFSLPGDYSIGSVGAEAYRFLDYMAEGGFRWWQVLPFCFPAAGNSPYSSFSAFSYHYALIDLPTLAEEGLITREELLSARGEDPTVCEYGRLGEERFSLLARAASRMTDRTPVYDYLASHPGTERFCRFMALRRANGGRPWQAFTTDQYDEEYYYAWAFTQYTFHRQWTALHAAAAARGIRILGDIPIYVDYESADVFSSPALFDLGKDGSPRSVAGVPPDDFAEEGQLWGNPLYDWARMKEDGYRWWRDRLAHELGDTDGVRIDHFRAFSSYYSIPSEARTALEGSWREGPGLPLVRALQETAGDRLLVAEDLGGDRAPDVRALLAESGLPGMRVFQFAHPEDPRCVHMPSNYTENTVAYTGTHDNNTLLGHLFSLPERERLRLFRLVGYEGEGIGAGFDAIVAALYASRASLVILPIGDVLRLGAEGRINRPGVAEGNWRVRVLPSQLARAEWSFFSRLARESGRT